MAANTMENNAHRAIDCKCVLFIHDELIFEVKDGKVQKFAKMIKNAMENPPLKRDFGIEFSVPLVGEPKVGQNLAEMEEMKI